MIDNKNPFTMTMHSLTKVSLKPCLNIDLGVEIILIMAYSAIVDFHSIEFTSFG